ncbi:hypothetical protein NQ176_g3442 [Zarea fungicola]|uniref:Uncharacterized protein n=1 Tax=Zarea fungicola TaxID=93591 RepID=A0ACC1NIG2_9HYPO|nr:hypothetical protein NQ176_g3442 [Lecanicillium fungicola]
MPFVGNSFPSSPPPARKRRRQDDDDDGRTIFTRRRPEDYASAQRCSFGGGVSYTMTSRRMVVAPMQKRSRFAPQDDNITSLYNEPESTPSHRRRSSHQTPRQKTPQPSLSITATCSDAGVRLTTKILAPCHICHRRPTKHSLDSFAQCEGCDEQTCFVCIRQCHGRGDMASVLLEQEALSRSFQMEDVDQPPTRDDGNKYHSARPAEKKPELASDANRITPAWTACGHRSVVCSRCCVERGPEGEVTCLGCLVGAVSPDSMMF